MDLPTSPLPTRGTDASPHTLSTPSANALIECVANVSEGRDRDRIDALAAAACDAADGVALLDIHVDPDHHRSVLTLAARGTAAIAAAAVALAHAATELIDVSAHIGAHPRLGALDVCPFVPLDGADAVGGALAAAATTLAACAAAGIPGFRYDAFAAAAGDVRTLPEIRRRAFGDLAPDVGPARPHPRGGAIAIGVRRPLVAYNIDLAAGGPAAARQIAARIRESAGGPSGLRAIALDLATQDRIQVSMNLTRPAECGVGTAWRAVAEAAADYGATLGRGELVGLVPRQALADADDEILARSAIGDAEVLEVALSRAGLRTDDGSALACDLA